MCGPYCLAATAVVTRTGAGKYSNLGLNCLTREHQLTEGQHWSDFKRRQWEKQPPLTYCCATVLVVVSSSQTSFWSARLSAGLLGIRMPRVGGKAAGVDVIRSEYLESLDLPNVGAEKFLRYCLVVGNSAFGLCLWQTGVGVPF